MEFYEEGLILESYHIYLRPISLEDKEALFNNIYHDKKVLEYYLTEYREDIKDLNLEPLIEYYKNSKLYCFVIVLKQSNEVIGRIHQVSGMGRYNETVELGYAIGSKYWNNGYVTEALKLMIELMFKRGVHKVSCGAIVDNIASKEVMKKCGMLYEGTDIDDIHYHGKYHNVDYYYILEDMFHVKH